MTETKKELVMDEDTVKNNFDVIRHLQPFQKLTINRKGKMTVDTRYLQCVRRALTWDCKYDILVPLERTFALVKGENDEEKLKVLNNFSVSVKQTYPDFDDLHKLVEKLVKECKTVNAKPDKTTTTTASTTETPIDIELDFDNAKDYNSTPPTPPPAPKCDLLGATGVAGITGGVTGTTLVCGKTSFRDALLSGNVGNTGNALQTQPPITPPNMPQKTEVTNMTTPMHMSSDMCDFLNISQKTKLTRKEIQVMMNAYIVNKKCLDMDTKMITPDEKLSRLLGCKTSKIPLTSFKYFYERHIM